MEFEITEVQQPDSKISAQSEQILNNLFLTSDNSESEYSSCSEYETEEEEDYEESNFGPLRPKNYIAEVKQTITLNEEVNAANAIELNLKFTSLLIDLRSKFQSLLKKCQERYVFNETRIIKLKAKSKEKYGKRGFYICGIPFIKNPFLKSSPANQDYLYRKYTLKEYFPVDAQILSATTWTTNDKCILIRAIRNQIIHFFQTDYKNVLEEKKIIKVYSDIFKLGRNKFPKLYAIVKDSNFKINWVTIALDLQSRHSPKSCVAMWDGYLQPDLNRSVWSAAEEKNLIKFAKQYRFQNWCKISEEIPKRSAIQCFLQFQSKLSTKAQVKNSKWTREEDELLMNAIEKSRMGNYVPWNKVCEYIPGRNKIQVYHRYMLTLNPTIKHEKFTIEEDCYLMAAIEQYGSDFSAIPSDILPGRTTVQLRNHFNFVLKSQKNGIGWTHEQDQQLLSFVEKNGMKKWSEISQIFGCHNRLVCRSRYMTIMSYLKKYPKATLADVPRKKNKQRTLVTRDNFIDTIIKIKQGKLVANTPNTRRVYHSKKKNLSFFDRLSKIDKGLFEYFKYSYKFKYGPNADEPFYKTINMLMLSKLLKVDLCNESIGLNSQNFSYDELSSLCKATNIKLSKNFDDKFKTLETSEILFPPNLSNILLYRGLSIMFPNLNEDTDKSTASKASSSTKNLESFQALSHIFKTRLNALLYWPTILSKLRISSIIPNFKNILNSSCEVSENEDDEEPTQINDLTSIFNPQNQKSIAEQIDLEEFAVNENHLENETSVIKLIAVEDNHGVIHKINENDSKVIVDSNKDYTISILNKDLDNAKEIPDKNEPTIRTSKRLKRSNSNMNEDAKRAKK